MLIGLNFKGKEILLDAENCGLFKRFKGLMFTSKKNAKPLLFDFKKETNTSLHSFFVFFKFLVFWLDKNNKVVDYRLCFPFKARISTRKKFSKVIEIPLKKEYEGLLKIL